MSNPTVIADRKFRIRILSECAVRLLMLIKQGETHGDVKAEERLLRAVMKHRDKLKLELP